MERLDGLQSVAEIGGALELRVLRGRLHLPAERVREDARLALEESPPTPRPRGSRAPRFRRYRGPYTGPSRSRDTAASGSILVVRTAAEAVGLSNRLHDRLGAALVGVRSEDGRGVLGVASDLDARDRVGRQLDQRVGFVVFQADVVARLVALDEVGFEEQRLRLGVGDGEVDGFGPFDHLGDALAARVGVGAHAVAQVDGLPDVEDPACRPGPSTVHAGLPWQRPRALSNLVGVR